MPETIVVRTQTEQNRMDYFFLIGVLIVIGIALAIFVGWGFVIYAKENPIFIILALAVLILLSFRKTIFKGSGKARHMSSKDSIKAYITYFLIYTIGVYLYLNYVAILINSDSIWLSYLFLAIALTILAKIGGLLINGRLILNKQTIIWIPVYMVLSYLFFMFDFGILSMIELKLPVQSIPFIVLFGVWITFTSRFAWNCIYRRY